VPHEIIIIFRVYILTESFLFILRNASNKQTYLIALDKHILLELSKDILLALSKDISLVLNKVSY
jgi:hypothetical protein